MIPTLRTRPTLTPAPTHDGRARARAGFALLLLPLSCWPAPVALALQGRQAVAQLREQFSLEGKALGDRFGTAVAGIGDANGDGRPDWVVGSPTASIHQPGAGALTLYSGADRRVLWRVEGPTAWARFGASACAVGDLNGDGHMDVLVGSPTGSHPAGEARVLSGLDGSTILGWTGQTAGEQFGRSLAGLGDLNADGHPDVAIGAPHADGVGLKCGRVTFFSGLDGSVLRAHEGAAAWDFYGSALASAGDVDADGLRELLIGAPFSDENGFNSGSAYLMSGADGSLLRSFHGSAIGDQFGTRLDAGLDVDGDGVPDCALGAPGSDRGGLDAGEVRIHSGADGALIHRVTGRLAGDGLHAVALVGDLDGDGQSEWVVGASADDAGAIEAGSIRLLSGREGHELASFAGPEAYGWLGAALCRLGDLDGDHRPEFAAGAPGEDDHVTLRGRIRVYGMR